MSLARQLITKIVDDQHLKEVINSGITKAWLNDPDSRAIFDGRDRECYLFILSHYDKYDQIPDREQILEDFDPSYEFVETERNLEFILDSVSKYFTRGIVDVAIGDLVEMFQEENIEAVIETMRNLVEKIDAIGRPDHTSITFNEIAKDIMAHINRPKAEGIKMNIPAVDENFGGMQPGQLITLLGRNKGMKTWLLLKLAVTAWDQGASSVVFSVELSATQIIDRLISIFAETRYEKIRKNTLSASEIRHIESVAESIVGDDAAVKVTIERDIQKFTIDDVRRSVEKHQPAIVFIDGFYFMQDKETGKTAINWEAHENLAADLKRLAERTGVIILVTTQVQEKQHNEKNGVAASTMMGGTGLVKASDLVLGVDKPSRESSVQKLPMLANREGEEVDSVIVWEFDKMTFEEADAAQIASVDTSKFEV